MPTIGADDARALARAFHELAVTLVNQRFDQWDTVSPEVRDELESCQLTLLKHSSDMTTRAMNLAVDDLQSVLADLRGATTQLNDAVRHTTDVRRAVALAAAAVTLGAAALSGNVSAVSSAIAGAVRTVRQATGPAVSGDGGPAAS